MEIFECLCLGFVTGAGGGLGISFFARGEEYLVALVPWSSGFCRCMPESLGEVSPGEGVYCSYWLRGLVYNLRWCKDFWIFGFTGCVGI